MADPSPPHGAGPARHADVDQTLLTVKVPPVGDLSLGPRVEHLAVWAAASAADLISASLSLPRWFVTELMRFGAVYWAPVHPLPPAHARTPASLETASRARLLAIARHGKSPALQHPRRLLADREIQAGAYLRVHVHPQRFPAFYDADWRGRLIHHGGGLVVANKPPGVQVVPRADNRLECLTAWVAGEVGVAAPDLASEIRPVHRLDAGTEGLVVMATSEAAARHLGGVMRDKERVRKCYRALSRGRPEVGGLVHSLEVGRREPGEPEHTVVCADGDPGGVRCELEVLGVREVAVGGGGSAFESTIALKTGKTHQIRAQLAAAGCPLVGDALYAAVAAKYGYPGGAVAGPGGGDGAEGEGGQRIRPGAARCERIGLQAFRLEFIDEDWEERFRAPRLFDAGPPWWRTLDNSWGSEGHVQDHAGE